MYPVHHQVLLNARPPHSQLLSCKPGNEPISWDFDKPVEPQYWVKLNSCRKPKLIVSETPSSFVLFKSPKFSTFI